MFRALLRDSTVILGLFLLAVLIAISIWATAFLNHQASALDLSHANRSPSSEHWLGTDRLGRDILARILVGARLSMSLAVAAAGIGAVVGIPLGAGISVLPLRLRPAALRAIDALFAFPAVLVAIFVVAIVGAGPVAAVLGVAIHLAVSFARISSSLALSVSSREYIAAARILGVSIQRLVFRHVLPNVAEPLIIAATVAVSTSILIVSSLSFLGLGVQPPGFDWGRMLTEGVNEFYLTPAAAVAPAAAIAITALAFGYLSEAAARAMNPVLWESGPASAVIAAPQVGPAARMRPLTSGETVAGGASRDARLEVLDLTVTYPGPTGPVAVVEGVTFTLGSGEILGVVGESGSGKSTLALAIAQLVPFAGNVTGTVRLKGNDLVGLSLQRLNELLATDLAIVFQDPLLSLNPALKLGIQLTERVEVHRRQSRSQAKALAVKYLAAVGLPTPEHQLNRYPHELSGGMRQRVMIAMGLMSHPVLLIADEPTTALDMTTQAQIVDLLRRVRDEHDASVLLISHNIGLVSQNCESILVMYAGRVVEQLSAEELLHAPLHPYTRALLAAVPTVSRPRDMLLEYIPGEAPSFGSVPLGCAYHSRCPLALPKCTTERPPLLARSDTHRVACWVANEDLNQDVVKVTGVR